jgi:hypothetical protein
MGAATSPREDSTSSSESIGHTNEFEFSNIKVMVSQALQSRWHYRDPKIESATLVSFLTIWRSERY